ncbi:MAG: NUDIX domain-containing protein, partial [Nanoarchaeota archaeon]|nr:NUDIX domain-containing protein [Nanoarchaeota archaeon]
MKEEKVIIVDENDNIIGSKERKLINSSEVYRVSALWVKNTKGDILLAQRKFDKINDPGKWGPAVAGTNDIGESYEDNILKETEEEIGLKGYKLKKEHKSRQKEKHNYFCQWFSLIIDQSTEDFNIQKEEVEK